MSREFSEEFGGGEIAEASQAGVIVVGDEVVQVGVAFGVIVKAAVMSGAVLRHTVEVFAEAAVEALDHAVGLRAKRADQAVSDRLVSAKAIKGVIAGRFVVGLALFVDGETVGEFGAVIGQDGMNLEWKAVEKALQEGRGGDGAAIGQDLEINKAGGAVACNISVTAAAVERRQVFDVDVE